MYEFDVDVDRNWCRNIILTECSTTDSNDIYSIDTSMVQI